MHLFRRQPANFQNMDARTYNQEYRESKAKHALIDVRTPGEFLEGHLPGAVNIPLNELPRRVKEVKDGVPVIVVCASGNRSQAGARVIADAGHAEVYNLKGGTFAWMMQGLPVER